MNCVVEYSRPAYLVVRGSEVVYDTTRLEAAQDRARQEAAKGYNAWIYTYNCVESVPGQAVSHA